jgi:hypothetical protein
MKKVKGFFRVIGAAVASLSYSVNAHAAGDIAGMLSTGTTQIKAGAAFVLIVFALIGLYLTGMGVYEFSNSKNNPQFSAGVSFGKVLIGVILMGLVAFVGIMAASSIGGGTPSGLGALGVGS